ncbi:MAG: hypothetical protein M3Z05_00105 [Gemmatimonadota bacterium]|nr:hypothetical protein [Gemmatimonadota bacterium]
MAQINIQKKSGSGWIWWMLGLLLLALIAWWMLARNTGVAVSDSGARAGTTTAPVPVVGGDSALGATGPITDLSMLAAATTGGNLIGRQVALTSAPVTDAVSDKGFWVSNGTAAGKALFVVRGNQNASYTAPDGAVTAGSTVNLWGVVKAMPSPLTQQATEWNLKSTDRDLLASRPLYIHADSVRLVTK